MDNLNVLVEAKKEYLGQLCIIMCPPMIDVFNDIYTEAHTISKGKKHLMMFQKLLQEVPNWSNAMSKSHSDNITNRCAWFSDLLAAVFVACTKILSSVRLKSDNKKISLKLPTNEVFIQTCYNNIAKDLYRDPYVFHEDQSIYHRDEKLTGRFCACIENSVKELIPVQQILQTYMSQDSRDIDLDGEVQDTEDPDVFDGEGGDPMGEPEGGMEPSPEELQENQPMENPMEEQSDPSGFDNEFKTVPGVQSPDPMEGGEGGEPQGEPQPQPEDDVLFGDAPDYRTKKVGYN